MVRKRREVGLCTHGLSDDLVICDQTVAHDFKRGTVQRTYGYYCGCHRRFGYWAYEEIIPKEQRRDMTGLPGYRSKKG